MKNVAHIPLVSIEPFRKEIAQDVFLSGTPLGTNVPGFSFIKIRDACDQDISTWSCYDPRSGKSHPRVPHDILDPTSSGWIVCNGREVVLRNGDKDEFCYTADPPPLRKVENGTLRVKGNGKANLLPS
jgi:hypothetical protein